MLHDPPVVALTVAASQTISEAFIPAWLRAYRAVYGSNKSVRLLSGNSDWVVEQIRAGRATVGFIETPEAPKGLHSTVIGEDKLLVVVPPENAWADGREITAEVLAKTPLVTRELGSGTRRTSEEALPQVGLGPVEPAAQLSSTGAVRSAIIGGVGPGIISARLITEELRVGRLVRVQTTLKLCRPLRAVWSNVLTESSRKLLDVIASGRTRKL